LSMAMSSDQLSSGLLVYGTTAKPLISTGAARWNHYQIMLVTVMQQE
jgi:hypothetical protein